MSRPPAAMSPATMWLACCDEPHCASTVVHPTSGSRRWTARRCGSRCILLAAWVTHPPMISCTIEARSPPARSPWSGRGGGSASPSGPRANPVLADRRADGFDDDGLPMGPPWGLGRMRSCDRWRSVDGPAARGRSIRGCAWRCVTRECILTRTRSHMPLRQARDPLRRTARTRRSTPPTGPRQGAGAGPVTAPCRMPARASTCRTCGPPELHAVAWAALWPASTQDERGGLGVDRSVALRQADGLHQGVGQRRSTRVRTWRNRRSPSPAARFDDPTPNGSPRSSRRTPRRPGGRDPVRPRPVQSPVVIWSTHRLEPVAQAGRQVEDRALGVRRSTGEGRRGGPGTAGDVGDGQVAVARVREERRRAVEQALARRAARRPGTRPPERGSWPVGALTTPRRYRKLTVRQAMPASARPPRPHPRRSPRPARDPCPRDRNVFYFAP